MVIHWINESQRFEVFIIKAAIQLNDPKIISSEMIQGKNRLLLILS